MNAVRFDLKKFSIDLLPRSIAVSVAADESVHGQIHTAETERRHAERTDAALLHGHTKAWFHC
jgi:hypothetical protein